MWLDLRVRHKRKMYFETTKQISIFYFPFKRMKIQAGRKSKKTYSLHNIIQSTDDRLSDITQMIIDND